MGPGDVASGGSKESLWSFGAVVIALIALAITQLLHVSTPAHTVDVPCASQPLIVISLPGTLPPAPVPAATPAATAVAVPNATPVASPEAAVSIGSLFRAGDPVSDHGLTIVDGPIVPLVIPQPCRLDVKQRRQRPLPCVALLPPGGTLCASGVSGAGRLTAATDAPIFALQATRVVLRDAAGELRIDALEGYFRYDDPERGLLLICPEIRQLERVGSNARRFIALCSNMGAAGWAVSGQVTDGSSAAPDSVGLVIDAPDGSTLPLVGTVAAGSVIVDDGQ